ncbi:NAD(P)/FAD-dependent oxidoreductase [Microbacterium sp. STN6]|uniref:NAD(P)/FAD-dependent oxidoreductase n=1 Tax=Microbacterium sp. STN6 TaxID=2995588 RepID=UPI00226103C5|nr:NAD(P)/FAD-dependent oxidoreductase [Microbacterium sp. STN6]MCX7522049.1 NAD(P)/FAD-dependent oxidoreductase [Microbacterium sp. STN6]
MAASRERYDVVVVGGGPAGLSAAVNLARARRHTLVIDSNRPRNAATLHAHGFLTRDGISPLELRALGRHEVESYPCGATHFGLVTAVVRDGDGFAVDASGVRGEPDLHVFARVVLITSGLKETLPALPSLRGFYGTSVHSCMECDGYEKRDMPLALIGESGDLAERALLLAQWSADIIVFTNGVGTVTADAEARLAARGIRVERRPIDDLVGERAGMTGVRLADGEVVARAGGFIRPFYSPALDYAASLELETDAAGLVVVDDTGATSAPGVYAAGDPTAAGPQQLVVAAGAGAVAAARINRDLLD